MHFQKFLSCKTCFQSRKQPQLHGATYSCRVSGAGLVTFLPQNTELWPLLFWTAALAPPAFGCCSWTVAATLASTAPATAVAGRCLLGQNVGHQGTSMTEKYCDGPLLALTSKCEADWTVPGCIDPHLCDDMPWKLMKVSSPGTSVNRPDYTLTTLPLSLPSLPL